MHIDSFRTFTGNVGLVHNIFFPLSLSQGDYVIGVMLGAPSIIDSALSILCEWVKIPFI